MNQSNEILKELQGISPMLAQMQKVNVFSIPDGYFNGLAEKITAYSLLNQNESLQHHLNHVEELDVPPSGVRRLQQVPKGYFDSLSDIIFSKIKISEGESIDEEDFQKSFPLLYSLKNKNVFGVPENYFEKVSEEIIEKINHHQPAKVISMSTKWWKYAVAAVVAGAIAFSSLQIFNGSSESDQIPTYVESSFKYKTPEQINDGIASLSDDEIIKYLEKNGSIMDNDLLIKEVDAKELPAAYDYLIDENTLNNYLDKIDAESNN